MIANNLTDSQDYDQIWFTRSLTRKLQGRYGNLCSPIDKFKQIQKSLFLRFQSFINEQKVKCIKSMIRDLFYDNPETANRSDNHYLN